MQAFKPCARCEQELPEKAFNQTDDLFCRQCYEDLSRIINDKYDVIEAAYFRAKLRRMKKSDIQRVPAQAARAG